MGKRLRQTTKVGAFMTLMATGLLVAGATPALADTSEATASAATLSLGGAPLVTTGTCSASHASDTSLPPDVCAETPALSLLGTQTAIAVGALVQDAVANPGALPSGSPATSAACAGAVGSPGTIQIGSAGDCTTQNLPSGGVTLDLGTLAQVHADAILGECTATSSPQGGTVSAQLVNATVQLLLAGVPVGPPIPLASSPAPNTTVLGLGSLLSITLNKTTTGLPPGEVGTTALDVSVLGLAGAPPLIHLTIGTVTCGPNAVAPDTPVIPLKGLPIALATAAAVGVVALTVRRRRRAVHSEI